MTVMGALIGGVAVARWGIFRALLIGGILQAVTNFAFAYVAMKGVPFLRHRRMLDEAHGSCAPPSPMTCRRSPSPSRPTTSPEAPPARRWWPTSPACATSPSPPRNTRS